MVKLLYSNATDFREYFDAWLAYKPESSANVQETVRDIIQQVKEKGDARLVEYTSRFDRWAPRNASDLRVTSKQIDDAYACCSKEIIAALELAADRIREYHVKQLPADFEYTDSTGTVLGNRWTPLSSAGLYVPGGLAAYPSSVLMNAVPAKVAGVSEVVMVSPAPEGMLSPIILAAAKIVGVTEIYKIGGAQAVAALAWGTETVPRVQKIVGPGNAYVAEAKRELFGVVGIDMIAGPSEILVVADNKNKPEWIAADLLSQAEHDAQARSILITDSREFAESVVLAVEKILPTLKRQKIARASWEERGLVIIDPHFRHARTLINTIAAEHVELALDNPEEMAKDITNAGAIFLGRYTPEAIGDYMAGPSHVLPTSGTAAFSSGLSVFDFIKRTSIISCNREAFSALAEATETLANAEGLGAHALSIALRK